jgi:hypothetical protein
VGSVALKRAHEFIKEAELSKSTTGKSIETALGMALLATRAYRLQRRLRTLRAIDSSLHVTTAGVEAASVLRTRASRRHQRRALRHTQRAMSRSRQIGPGRAATDRRVRHQLQHARDHAVASVRPPEHTVRNRLMAAGALAVGVAAGRAAVGAVRSRSAQPTSVGA